MIVGLWGLLEGLLVYGLLYPRLYPSFKSLFGKELRRIDVTCRLSYTS